MRPARPKSHSRTELDKKVIAQTQDRRFPSFRQLKYLPRVLSTFEKISISFAVLIILGSLGFLGYHNIYLNLEIVPANGGTLTEGVVGAPQHINPIFAQTNDIDLDISRLVFSGLFGYNESLELTPALASDYSISEDYKTYTISLRQDISWHDGEPFTAEDVVYTIQTIQDENVGSPLYRTFQGVTVSQSDEYTVSFTLAEPYAAFLHVLTVGIIPQHIWIGVPPVNARLSELNTKPIGTGPFKFKSLVKDSRGVIKSYTLEKNKEYFGNVPYLDEIQFKFYGDTITALNALLNKNVQSLGFLPRSELEQVEGKRRFTIHEMPLAQLNAIFLNDKINPVLESKEVRKALAMSVDTSYIIDSVLNGHAQRAEGPILAGFLGYADDIAIPEYQPQEAADLLLEQGWELDGEHLTKDDEILAVTITTIDQPEYVSVAEAITQYWENIGVKTNIELVAPEQIQQQKIIPREYGALLFGVVIGYDPDPYPFWHSSQREHPGVNLTSYGNRNTDQILEEARQTTDTQLRADKYRSFQGILAEAVPAVFLYSPTYLYPVPVELQGVGVEQMATTADRFIGVEKWYLETKRALPF